MHMSFAMISKQLSLCHLALSQKLLPICECVSMYNDGLPQLKDIQMFQYSIQSQMLYLSDL